MRLWKLLLVVISIVVLPSALVAVGPAQQLTCWGLRGRIEDNKEPDVVPDSNQREGSSPSKIHSIGTNISRFLSLLFPGQLVGTT